MRLSFVCAVVCVLVVPRDGPAQAAPSATTPEIVVNGVGVVRIKPDRATLLFAVQANAKSAALAATDNARRMRAVLDTLRAIGFGPEAIATIGITISQAWRPARSPEKADQPNGYNATNSVQLSMLNLDRIGLAIDAALAAGATNISSLQFGTSGEARLQLQALDSAVANARSRAEVMARAAGGSLGALRTLTTEPEQQPGFRVQYGMTSMSAQLIRTPTEAGDISITVGVVGRWLFVPR